MELYRLANGSVINELKWDSAGHITAGEDRALYEDWQGDSSFYTILAPLTPTYIKTIPKSPNWPNNYYDLDFGYVSYPAAFSKQFSTWYFTCGDKPWGSYTFFVVDANSTWLRGATNYNLGSYMAKFKYYAKNSSGVWEDGGDQGNYWCVTG